MGGAPSQSGQSAAGNYCTDFESSGIGGLVGLRQMIQDADPAGLENVSYKWRVIHDALVEAQQALGDHTRAATEHWSGSASDAFSARADELAQSLGNGADYALNAADGTSMAARALRDAQGRMPSVPNTVDEFKRWATSETSDSQFKSDLASGMSRSAALQRDGSQLSLLEERHQQAIVVMQELEGEYESAAARIGQPASPTVRTDSSVFPPPPSNKPVASTPRSSVNRVEEAPVAPGQEAPAGSTWVGGGQARTRTSAASPETSTSQLDGATGIGEPTGSTTSRTGSGGTAPGAGPGGRRPGPAGAEAADSLAVRGRPGRRSENSEVSQAGEDVKGVQGTGAEIPTDSAQAPSDSQIPTEDTARPGSGSPTAYTESSTSTSATAAPGTEDPTGSEGIPSGLGGAGALGPGRKVNRRRRRRRHYGLEEDGPLGDELNGHDGINERFEPPVIEPCDGVKGGSASYRPLPPDDGKDISAPVVHMLGGRRPSRGKAGPGPATGQDPGDGSTANPSVIE
ncbi:hypothetical protein ABH932_000840 [Streptacidiphilus sp. MAP5-52]